MYVRANEGLGQATETTSQVSKRSWLQEIAEEARIRVAMAQGVRDLNELTNLVFFMRHPEREGRKLLRGEPQFDQLAQEWRDIRDNVVRRALEPSPLPGAEARPTPVPSTTLAPIPAWLKGRRCPKEGGTTTDRCTGGAPIPCPSLPDLLCVTAVNDIPFEYVADTSAKPGQPRKTRIRQNAATGLWEVVDRLPNREQRFIPEVGAALYKFLANMTKFGMPVAAILTMGSLYCRCIGGTNELSNHSYGDAIDITGVRWAASGGPPSTLPDTIIHNFNSGDQREMDLIRRINACLRLSFATVLDYNYKPRPHRDHFHCDMNRKRGRPIGERSGSTWYFVQEALSTVLRRSIPQTGRLDPATQQGLKDFAGVGSEVFGDKGRLNGVLDALFQRVASGR